MWGVCGTFASAEVARRLTTFSHRTHEKNISPICLDDNRPSNQLQLVDFAVQRHNRGIFLLFFRANSAWFPSIPFG
jgi:hypothetical protein